MGCCQAAAPIGATARKLELADIFRRFSDELPPLTSEQQKAVRDIKTCRTEVLGGHVYRCGHCGHRQEMYNSCRNRHCPKCQSLEQARWLEARHAELLPVEYFHVVFTVPDELKALFLVNRAACYKLIFAAVAETLQDVALNPERLGARIGFIAVLPKGLVSIRYYGFLANSVKQQRIALCRQLLGANDESVPPDPAETWQELLQRLTAVDPTLCPVCGTGHMALFFSIPAITR